jgi:hypothetical protein
LELPRFPIFLLITALLAPLVAFWVTIRSLVAIFSADPNFHPAQTIPWEQRPTLKHMTVTGGATGVRESGRDEGLDKRGDRTTW